MKKIYSFLLSLVICFAFGQGGQRDVSFAPPSSLVSNGQSGLALLPSGELLLEDSGTSSILKKLNKQGLPVSSFIQGTTNGIIRKIYVKDNNNIYVAGNFTTYNGITKQKIVKINSNGQINNSFNASFPSGFNIHAIAMLSDGNIVVGGNGLYKINGITGLTVSGFTTGTLNIDSGIADIVILPNDEILAGGNFTTYNGTARRCLARISSNGLLMSYPQIPGNSSSSRVDALAIDSFNNVFVGGQFVTSNNKLNILKINSSNTIDTNFATTFSIHHIMDIVVQKNGKIVVCGNFETVNGLSRRGIVRLHENGNVDNCFDPGLSYDADYFEFHELTIDSANDIYVNGLFFSYRGTAIPNQLIKIKGGDESNPITLNDDVFNVIQNGSTNGTNVLINDIINGSMPLPNNITLTSTPISPAVNTISFNLANGSISVAPTTPPGTYTFTYTVCPKTGCSSCKTANATINVSFPQIDAVNDVQTVAQGTNLTFNLLTNDKHFGSAVIGGNPVTTTLSLSNISSLITINATSGLVTVPNNTPAGTYIFTYTICTPYTTNCDMATITINVTPPPVNEIIAVDDYIEIYPGQPISIHPFDNDSYNGGEVNLSNVNFFAPTLPDPPVYLDQQGNIIVTDYAWIGLTSKITYYLTDRLNSENTVYASVTVKIISPPISTGLRANNSVSLSGIQTGGKIVISGAFTAYNNTNIVNGIARLNSDLTFDSTFLSTGPTPSIAIGWDMKIHPSNQIFICGRFTAYNGINSRGIARLTSDGEFDTTFNAGGSGLEGGDAVAYCSDRYINGRVVVVGQFTSYNGVARNNIVRLTPQGGNDATFIPGLFEGGTPHSVVIQSNSQIIVTGGFTSYQGVTSRGIARMSSTGAIDTAFSTATGTGFTGGALLDKKLLLQSDNKIIVYGNFTAYNGVSRKNIVRINTDGSLDTSFNPGLGFNGMVTSVVLESDGKMIVGGNFTQYNGASVKTLVRLNANGLLDTTFNVGTGPSGGVYTLTRQSFDGKVIVGGTFLTYNQVSAQNVTRIAPSIAGSQLRTFGTLWESEPEIDTNPFMKSGAVSIYPNPSDGIFNIDFKGYDEQKFDMTIYNTLGQQIYKGIVMTQNTKQIDLTNFEAGSYFITLQSNTETINKIVVKK